MRKRLRDLVEIPRPVEQTLELGTRLAKLGRHLSSATDFLYLGRGLQYPIALEGDPQAQGDLLTPRSRRSAPSSVRIFDTRFAGAGQETLSRSG